MPESILDKTSTTTDALLGLSSPFCSFAAALAWVAVAALAVPCFKALTPRPFIIAAITYWRILIQMIKIVIKYLYLLFLII
jgi:hypothetical protein